MFQIRQLLLASVAACFTSIALAQSLSQKITTAFHQFASHESLAYGTASLTVINAKTNQIVFSANEKVGLAPASTLKTLTSAAAYYLLGADYTYETTLAYSGEIDPQGNLKGDIIIRGSGDPSLGSDRFPQTSDQTVLSSWVKAIQQAGIRHIDGAVIVDDSRYNGHTAPGGWTWQDMGNYYGAGVSALNWRENAVGVNFRAGNTVNAPTAIAGTTADIAYLQLVNETTTGERGTGDRVYAFSAPYASRIYLRGTYGIDLRKTVYLSLPDGAYDAAYQLHTALANAGIDQTSAPTTFHLLKLAGSEVPQPGKVLENYRSPALRELIYWFNQKSINLYGEAFLKTMVYQEEGKTDTRDGAEMLRDFWADKLAIAPGELKLMDGSGLSPENRITTHAMARILTSIRNAPWFGSFYESLPTYNGMKMKSGTIGGVLGYTGYQTATDGTPLVFSLLVNNYQGRAQPMRQRMFRLLNTLK